MRKPSEFIAAAVRGVRDNLMSDCSRTLAHGCEVGRVTLATTMSRGEDAVSESGVTESMRVLALAADFPDITKGDPAKLDGTLRAVTSVRLDPSRTMQYVGLSAPFKAYSAVYTGTRRGAGGAGDIQHNASILVLDAGNATDYPDAIAPTYERRFLVAIRAADWTYPTTPEVSDNINAAIEGKPLTLKVSVVTRHVGWFILQCRARG